MNHESFCGNHGSSIKVNSKKCPVSNLNHCCCSLDCTNDFCRNATLFTISCNDCINCHHEYYLLCKEHNYESIKAITKVQETQVVIWTSCLNLSHDECNKVFRRESLCGYYCKCCNKHYCKCKETAPHEIESCLVTKIELSYDKHIGYSKMICKTTLSEFDIKPAKK